MSFSVRPEEVRANARVFKDQGLDTGEAREYVTFQLDSSTIRGGVYGAVLMEDTASTVIDLKLELTNILHRIHHQLSNASHDLFLAASYYEDTDEQERAVYDAGLPAVAAPAERYDDVASPVEDTVPEAS